MREERCGRAERAGRRPLGLREVLRRPLPHLSLPDRLLLRGLLALLRDHVERIEGLEHVAPECDPFLLVLNHNQKYEVLAVPALLMFHRGGRLIHFLADWNYQLVPGVWWIYRRARVVRASLKPAKPAWLNVFKPLLTDAEPAYSRAARLLAGGAPVGIFPEGRINRDPRRLLPGRPGAARLSIEAGVPVVPAGIRFPGRDPASPIEDGARMAVQLGPPMEPPPPDRGERASRRRVLEWHAAIMERIAELSGKAWTRRAPERAVG
ncbi:MAG: 1-acyl-sn-glycerol-3-phosphate acyltransferase [Acidobacteria bacterium]|nr:MAG: 1-acyl-sn-glycerol-3-phosphate acyltransferase [Acidobacteriota bacterium]